VGNEDGQNESRTVNGHLSDLIIGAFFFAMRGCEFSDTGPGGLTSTVTLGDLRFRRSDRSIVDILNGDPSDDIEFVTVTFREQKNGQKSEKRTQRKTRDPILCPVKRWVSVAKRLMLTVADCDESTEVCCVGRHNNRAKISGAIVRESVRRVCRLGGGGQTYGFEPDQIGLKSIRSGAAMSLALSRRNYSSWQIMILGRWRSEAFLKYIRPQVLEWTSHMAQDMAETPDFREVSDPGGRSSSRQLSASAPEMFLDF